MTTGMSRLTGRRIEGTDHLMQSIQDIVSTQRSTRVIRRDYGIVQHIDAPINGTLLADIAADVATALDAHEPRFALQSVEWSDAGPDGAATVDLSGVYRPTGEIVVLPGVRV